MEQTYQAQSKDMLTVIPTGSSKHMPQLKAAVSGGEGASRQYPKAFSGGRSAVKGDLDAVQSRPAS